ncbi:hypothetical protein THASP1DRAFT_24642 [Thamnocephalis sphaerospora]|uniref:DASH complex subunit SPC19 n=1 Tax=Thamnocephalis sphaerospora TaxID=78915 RepID=A0A4V1IWD3_9FUNG|nr:hypothetical protein THASP1DRAFT_24642 [Thamnocephalis sphaerospora]|eukprot:RKP07159.1 hypothetical protein THASP1DRAFT_24642 [Thamnocephalis sphaerospora]
MNAQLQGCVVRLQEMNEALAIATQRLKHATRDFPRMQTVMALRKCELKPGTQDYDVVTEGEVRAAKDQVADEVEPQIVNLLSQAEDILNALEAERDDLAARLEEAKRPPSTPAKRGAGAKPGIHRLKALKRRKQLLLRDLERMEHIVHEKEQTLVEESSTLQQDKDVTAAKESERAEEEHAAEKRQDHHAQLTAELELLSQALEDRRAQREVAREAAQAKEAKKERQTQPERLSAGK